jgi:prepilin-type N-terminal cleavage/methylation domain-containing protein
MISRTARAGFTLIELLIVIGILGVLSGVVIVSINPNKQLAEARNAKRESDLRVIVDAVYQYSVDHNGNFPPAVPLTPTAICRSGVNIDCSGLVNLNILTGSYIAQLPYDPQSATAKTTFYTIVRIGNRVTVDAPGAEQGEYLSVTR